MTTRVIYVELMSGSLVPLDKVVRIEEGEDGCVVSIDEDGRLRCAERTLVESLRVLEIDDDRIGWTWEEAEQ